MSLVPQPGRGTDMAPGRRAALARCTLLAGLSLIMVACHDASGAPPASSNLASPRPAEISVNQQPTLEPVVERHSESTPEIADAQSADAQSADAQSADLVAATESVAAPAAEVARAAIEAREESTDEQSAKIIDVVSVEQKEPLPPQIEPEARPDSLIGADRSDVRARLGTPALLRREPPAEFWQFAGDGCVLHVYLYETTSGERYEVTHVELLPRNGLDAVPSGCFGRMLLGGHGEAG